MKHELKTLVDKRFSVYVGDEFERFTDFIGLMKLLADYSDFFRYTDIERRSIVKEWMKSNYIYVDANISVRFK